MTEFKIYLKDYLTDERNNGKLIMISGKWGSGKTYMWKHSENSIEGELLETLSEDKSYVYISLYGKKTLKEIQQDIFLKALSSRGTLPKELEAFGVDVLSSLKDSNLKLGKLLTAVNNINSYFKAKRGKKSLQNGGIVCIDDFERVSKSIDLESLFGFLHQMTETLNCKTVVILNQEAFEGHQKDIFVKAKEKTVQKFIEYNPSLDDLFDLIFQTYQNELESYEEILKDAIRQCNEINARNYIAALENCLEWKRCGCSLDGENPKLLVYQTFIYNNIGIVLGDIQNSPSYFYYPHMRQYPQKILEKFTPEFAKQTSIEDVIFKLMDQQNDKTKKWVQDNKRELIETFKYGYKCDYVNCANQSEQVEEIRNFVKTGLLLKSRESENQESRLREG